ncbi:hypothetical protein ADL27_38430 [Streptomyces sp. NRRL F-6602]|uniref:hypothetical protein n=1 Tax=Streptomyces sp. NRRL F-5630 TaxID=1463864 RepID=UPI0004CC32B5|nr:hypothetical protein [Streptomyces sp. NRRL F-5630]KPC89895.1 hypothetical protein ADL27_38430 [Streptomyces sp. NRRL F-6602]
MSAVDWADCRCCWPQKPAIRKAVGWRRLGKTPDVDEAIPPFWYLKIGPWSRGHYDTWEEARDAAFYYLSDEGAHIEMSALLM